MSRLLALRLPRRKEIGVAGRIVHTDNDGEVVDKSSARCHCLMSPADAPVASKLDATFNNMSTGRATVIQLRGDFWGGSGDLTVENGPTVAQITRQLLNPRQVLVDKQTVSG